MRPSRGRRFVSPGPALARRLNRVSPDIRAEFARLDRGTAGRRAYGERSVRRLFLHSSPPRAGGLADQVVALGDVRGPAGGLGVRRGGGRELVAQLVQVAADRVPAV